jgi:hypothetical protein
MAMTGAQEPFTQGAPPGVAGTPLAVRAQLLATEHWSLLATRSMVTSEMLTRMATLLALVSSSIVGLALIGQVTRFDWRFVTFALILDGMLFVIGSLTHMRVWNASMEDLAHVIGMNRLRAAYVEIDPAIARYLVTSPHDDPAGIWQTYNHLAGPNMRSNVLASSATFITFVNSGLLGAFFALVAIAFGAPTAVVIAAAAFGAVSFAVVYLALGRRSYIKRVTARPVLFPSPKVR